MLEFHKLKIKGPSVTLQEVKDAILHVTYTKLGRKITVAHVTLRDGFEVIGKSGVVDPSKYNIEIGSDIALKNAMDRVWEHMGSILQDRLLAK